MNVSPSTDLRRLAIETLASNGYQLVGSPFQIGDIELDIDDVLEGPSGTLSMAVVVDHPRTREGRQRVYWSLQRLARALDAAGSQRSLTAVLIVDGGTLPDDLGDIQSLARVLVVSEGLRPDQSLAPLLRLELPAGVRAERDGIERLERHVRGKKSASQLLGLLASSRTGKEAVEATFESWIDDAFSIGKGL